MFDRRCMVVQLLVKSTECEVDQRRHGTHSLSNALTLRDRLLYLKPEPASVVLAKYLICGEIEFKDTAGVRPGFGGEHLPDKKGEYADKKEQKNRKTSYIKHEGDHAEAQRILPSFL